MGKTSKGRLVDEDVASSCTLVQDMSSQIMGRAPVFLRPAASTAASPIHCA